MEGKRLCNHQTIKGLQNALQKGMFYIVKGHLLHHKIILQIQLVENKEATLLMQLNW